MSVPMILVRQCVQLGGAPQSCGCIRSLFACKQITYSWWTCSSHTLTHLAFTLSCAEQPLAHQLRLQGGIWTAC